MNYSSACVDGVRGAVDVEFLERKCKTMGVGPAKPVPFLDARKCCNFSAHNRTPLIPRSLVWRLCAFLADGAAKLIRSCRRW